MVYSENDNPEFQLAWELVNQTGCSLFLSGKAGTGKTTFLQKVRSECTKNLVVLAPTGVAAIHAGGSTIHSFFQLPLAPFLPGGGHGFQLHGDFSDSHSLFRNIRFNQNKKALIESLELMIIDEVSMLRSDTLDAMDWVLRTFRKNPLPFGGVQCVFIGDLYQLPPVLKDQEKNLLSTHYLSPFFFDAHALRQHPIQYIELKKIYRQTDSQFVELLNKVRHQSLSEADFQTLNQLYQPEHAEKAVDAITLCTHNFRADIINQSELKKLQAPSFRYSAAVEGDFNSRQYPTEEHLELKCGAKVMFIKNDPQNKKRFFNGKIGTITRLENERIFVQFQDADTELEVEKMNWEQIHYHLNPETRQIEEKVTGRFTQFPLRLAWAITIHKSQGLTFDNAIIDAGQSFAPGQVYVALSRCRTLSGIRLRSQILPQSLHTEIRIQSLPFREHLAGEMQHFLQVERFKYQQHRFEKLFRFQDLHQALKTAREIANSTTS
ncbi:MAG TPA: AAA family ATPase, partial [Chitinophagaceae bacterium]|nr:AAA family ATPase [Chitinophagaceae bacterium]